MRDDLFHPRHCFAAIPDAYTDFDTARVAILPVPYDSTTDWRAGSREGPQAIITASEFIELYDPELDKEVYRVGIHTLPSLKLVQSSPEAMAGRVYQACRWLLEQGKMVVMLGGEHSLTAGAVRAYKEKFPELSVLQLDAHADLRDSYEGTKYSHACVMRRVLELCPIVPVGIRSLSLEESQFIRESGLAPFYASQWRQDPTLPERVVAALTPHVYISLDLDVFDPSVMSAVGTPEPGGLLWHEVVPLLRLVARGRRVVGFDIVELCPAEGPAACAYLAATLVYKLIGYATAQEL
ncbi:MAG TPA: agmatinase [Dehalococcoidia bacterium]|nr:agmatinase [Dehalococcoidia bacterium]